MTHRTAVRLIADGFNSRVKSFCSILGATQYMTVNEFSNILGIIGRLQSPGSSLVFDYHCFEDEKLVSLAAAEEFAKIVFLTCQFYNFTSWFKPIYTRR